MVMVTNKLKFSSLLCALTTLDSVTKVTNLHSLYYRLCYQGNQSSFALLQTLLPR